MTIPISVKVKDHRQNDTQRKETDHHNPHSNFLGAKVVDKSQGHHIVINPHLHLIDIVHILYRKTMQLAKKRFKSFDPIKMFEWNKAYQEKQKRLAMNQAYAATLPQEEEDDRDDPEIKAVLGFSSLGGSTI